MNRTKFLLQLITVIACLKSPRHINKHFPRKIEEMQALKDNDTFELTSLPEGRKTVGAVGCLLLSGVQMGKRNTKLVLWRKDTPR